MRIYPEGEYWRIRNSKGEQISQVFKTRRAAQKYLALWRERRESFKRFMNYPGKIVPIEWIEKNHKRKGEQNVKHDGR